MIGIYGIYRSGSCVYVGQSINITKRLSEHKNVHQHSKENYAYSVLVECDRADLDGLEEYWIDKLGTYEYGENKTPNF